MEIEQSTNIEYAQPGESIVVIRIGGRGTFHNSPCLEKLEEEFCRQNENVRFIIDLEKCNYMDSTFMGVLAYMGTNQIKRGVGKMTVLNQTNHTLKLLSTLGLTQILDVHFDKSTEYLKNADFEVAECPEQDKYTQIVHMLEAHKKLIDIDGRNEVQFEKVVTLLSESLKREEEKDSQDQPC